MKNTFQKFQTSVAVLASLLFAESANAQGLVTSFIAEGPVRTSGGERPNVGLTGSFGRQYLGSDSTVSAQLDLNDDERTVTFRRFAFYIEDLQLSGSLATGLGASNPTVLIEGSIDFDPIVFEDDEALPLVSSTGNQFTVPDFQTNSLPIGKRPRISGSYEFSGPTESVDGTFGFVSGAFRSGGPTIDTTNFPNGVEMLGDRYFWAINPRSVTLFTETIDGAEVSVGLGESRFANADNLELVPETSTYAFASGICLVAFVAFRRMRIAKSSA